MRAITRTVLVAAALIGASAARAQVPGCPPPLKYVAGACVAVCPGGYEDRGRTCEHIRGGQ